MRQRHPCRQRDISAVELRQLGAERFHVLDVGVPQLRLRDQRGLYNDVAARVFACQQHRQSAYRYAADHGRIGGGGRRPTTPWLAHRDDIRSGNIGRVDLDLRRELRVVDGHLHAAGKFVVRSKYHGNVRMGRQRQARLRGDRFGNRVIYGAERRYFLNARILYLECFPGLIAAVERGDARDVDEAGFEAFAIIPDCLLEDEAGKIPVGLLYLRDLVVLDVDVEGNHLDASIHRALCGRFQGVGWAVLYDNAVDTKRDRLVDHFGLALGVLPAVEHLQVDAECLRLLFGAGEIRFKEIAGRKVANQRHSDAARFIERGRQAACTGC